MLPETVSSQGKLKNFSCILRGACKRKNFVGSHLPKCDKLSTRTVEQDLNALTLTKDSQCSQTSACKSDTHQSNSDEVQIDKSLFSSLSQPERSQQTEKLRKNKSDYNPSSSGACILENKSKTKSETEDKPINDQVKLSKAKTTGSCTSSRYVYIFLCYFLWKMFDW